jgi:alpha-beta hydrolase superfamily lysophospholipase
MAHQIATNARDTRGQLANITLPTLLFFGEADTVVDPAGARVFAERAASPDLTVWPLPGLMHETFNEPGGAEIVDRMVDWLDARTSRDPGLTV